MARSSFHLVIATGGTGGHFYPTLAIARELRQRGVRVTVLVAGKHAAAQLALAGEHEVPGHEVPACRLPHGVGQMLLFPFRFAHALAVAWFRLRSLRPAVVLGMGSFASVPVCMAAALSRLPLVVHEGNAWIGKANRFLSRWARSMATSLPLAPGQAARCPQSRTGMPLRDAIIKASERKVLPSGYFDRLGLTPGREVVLVFGGSQGAAMLNQLMRDTVGLLGRNANRLQIIHLTGTDANEEFVEAYQAAGVHAYVAKSEEHIENCYLAAELVICRAGASTLSELAVFGRPAVLIPFRAAAEDHQTANAQVLAQMEAARLLPETAATPDTMASLLGDWLDNGAVWRRYGEKIRSIACPAAARTVADMLSETVGVSTRG